jgi:hypothetical protein
LAAFFFFGGCTRRRRRWSEGGGIARVCELLAQSGWSPVALTLTYAKAAAAAAAANAPASALPAALEPALVPAAGWPQTTATHVMRTRRTMTGRDTADARLSQVAR